MPISDLLIPEFDEEMNKTRSVLERLPEDKYGWKPHDKSFAMGALATHVAVMMGWLVDTVARDTYDVAPPGQEPYRETPVTSRAALLKRFDQGVTAAREALAGASDDHWMKPWSLLSGGQVLFTLPRYSAVRVFVMNHVIHHRAQLGVYLRLNDLPVPALYGPSADEQG